MEAKTTNGFKSFRMALSSTVTLVLFALFICSNSKTFAQGCSSINNNNVGVGGTHAMICFFDAGGNSMGVCLDCQLTGAGWKCGAAFNAFTGYYRASIGGVDCFNPSVLPVSTSEFNANSSESGVTITWVSQSESNNDYYTLEKSVHGVDFFEVATISGAGNSTAQKVYSFVDERAIVGTNYYRLSQTDYDGTKTVIETISVNNKSSKDVTVYPNPANSNEVNVSFKDLEMYSIVSTTGQTLFSGTEMETKVNLTQFSNGTYFMKFNFKNGNTTEKILVVAK